MFLIYLHTSSVYLQGLPVADGKSHLDLVALLCLVEAHGSISTIFSLKRQVTFLKLSLQVVCMALVIPRFTLFRLTTVFRSNNAFIFMCLRQHFLLAPAGLTRADLQRLCFFGCNTKSENRFIVAFSASFPFTNAMYIKQHAVILRFHMFIKEWPMFQVINVSSADASRIEAA